MRRYLPVLLVLVVLQVTLPATAAAVAAESVAATGLAQSLLQDLQSAQSALDRGQTPWPEAQSRPQAEPLTALRLELPGSRLWSAFQPVDAAIREAYRQQRKMYIDEDAGLIDRRTARTALDDLTAALGEERPSYNATVVSRANRQILQIDFALSHHQYHAALCIMWAMADALGLWDRQAALESAADHLARLRAAALRRQSLPPGTVRYYKNQLGCIATIVERAVAWQPAPQSIGPSRRVTTCPDGALQSDHWAREHFEVGGAFDPWRNNSGASGATPWVLNQPIFRLGLQEPPRETRDITPCPERYRDWQHTLRDYRWGWFVYNDSAASGWRPHGDWRDLQPTPFWPGERGIDNAGGL